MKHPLDYISDWWNQIWYHEDELYSDGPLAVLAFTHRLSRRRTVAVVTAVRQRDWVLYHAYEVEDLSLEGWAHLNRIIEGTPSVGELIVWLWHQGVCKPVETWKEETE